MSTDEKEVKLSADISILPLKRESHTLRFRLLQARDPDDPVLPEERQAFATRLGVDLEQIESCVLVGREVSWQDAAEGVDAVLVGGSGAYSVTDGHPWIDAFVRTLAGLADNKVPVFASCFGFQGLVLALGGDVRGDSEAAEVGSFELECLPEAKQDPLFEALPTNFFAQEGHKDRAFTLPSRAINLVQSNRCPYQAIKVKEAPVYATQFHPELTGEENCARFRRYEKGYRAALGDDVTDQIMRDFRESPEANRLLLRFMELLQEGKLR